MAKTRIAVLGAGPGALGAVWELTQSPNWSDRYEIDVYAMGWRLGGKTASGRNPKHRYRNEEHGLHILGGFYHNTFQQLKPLYDAWNMHPEDLPLTLDQSVSEYGRFSIMQREGDGSLREVRFALQPDARKPGENPDEVNPKNIIKAILRWVTKGFVAISKNQQPAWGSPSVILKSASIKVVTSDKAGKIADTLGQAEEQVPNLGSFGPEGAKAEAEIAQIAADTATEINGWLKGDRTDPPIDNIDWLGTAGLALTIVKGLVKDRVFAKGFGSIDQYDAKEWLVRHGAPKRALRNGNFVAGYSYAFAFTDGDPDKMNFAAGTALRSYFRMLFASHGNLFWHMRGGMGEVFVLPYYDVLRRRGVRFHFFHKVTDLIPDGLGSLGEIIFQVQAKTSGSAEYNPIAQYRPGPSAPMRRTWLSHPDWAQLKNGPELEASGIDFESMFGPIPPGSATESLLSGRDFDLCIVAIPPTALQHISRQLAADSRPWADMLANCGSSPTIAAQTWRTQDVRTYGGWSSRGLMTAYELPLDTWADMSFLLKYEQPWPTGMPLSLSYFCGAVLKPDVTNQVDLPASERSRAVATVEDWMSEKMLRAFPGLRASPGDYQPETERISLINSDPAKLYITSPKGQTKYRLRPDGSGFANMFLAGDWTRHNFDCGAVESAIISARRCARAICGSPAEIYGETDFT